MLFESMSTKIRGAVSSLPLNPRKRSQLLSMNILRRFEKLFVFLMEATRMKGNSKTIFYIFYLSQFRIRCWLYLKGEMTVVRKRAHRVAAL
jgi:hypothetical protein